MFAQQHQRQPQRDKATMLGRFAAETSSGGVRAPTSLSGVLRLKESGGGAYERAHLSVSAAEARFAALGSETSRSSTPVTDASTYKTPSSVSSWGTTAGSQEAESGECSYPGEDEKRSRDRKWDEEYVSATCLCFPFQPCAPRYGLLCHSSPLPLPRRGSEAVALAKSLRLTKMPRSRSLPVRSRRPSEESPMYPAIFGQPNSSSSNKSDCGSASSKKSGDDAGPGGSASPWQKSDVSDTESCMADEEDRENDDEDECCEEDDSLDAAVIAAVDGDLALAAYLIPLLHRSFSSAQQQQQQQQFPPHPLGMQAGGGPFIAMPMGRQPSQFNGNMGRQPNQFNGAMGGPGSGGGGGAGTVPLGNFNGAMHAGGADDLNPCFLVMQPSFWAPTNMPVQFHGLPSFNPAGAAQMSSSEYYNTGTEDGFGQSGAETDFGI
ncbi:hypothetical protein MAPG_06146 [Magnaporthiopsis poae ATCC 64411]|uniref:Uncharacterized protein n=1 Tax=Magnaporthiopsis poae (strain ATCC 64411 / 73-15) TaxID=644358 RepID=A0A0C4E192_MAGP6|nr:hypothetical protein MAPG_06146 [Magnaporthiopsis poae ATCC 64411]